MVILHMTLDYNFGKILPLYCKYFLMYVSIDSNKQGHAKIALYDNLLVSINLTSVHGFPNELHNDNRMPIQQY